MTVTLYIIGAVIGAAIGWVARGFEVDRLYSQIPNRDKNGRFVKK